MISKIRTYIKNQVSSYDSTYQHWDDGFNRDNIPSTILDKSYFISYQVPSVDQSQAFHEYSVEVSIEFFHKGFRNITQAIDTYSDNAILISDNILSVSNIEAFRLTDDFPIQSVGLNSMAIDNIQSNDNSFIITLDFNFLLIRGNC